MASFRVLGLARQEAGGDGFRLGQNVHLGHTVRRLLLVLSFGGGVLGAPGSAVAQESWAPTSSIGVPSARTYHTAVWTGSKMIVWGGQGTTQVTWFDTGGVYDPAANVWTATSTTGAPSARKDHTAVWTGSKMIVWGGSSGATGGGVYEPSTNTWAATSTVGAPSGRFLHTAVWTGSEMIVWGGEEVASSQPTNTGAIYSPEANSWRATSTVGAPSARSGHAAVWSGSRMIVWGGYDGASFVNTGGIYDPATGIWAAMSTMNAPTGRGNPATVWTGSKMIVWGGSGTNTGGIYDPVADVWTATSTTGAPTGRQFHSGVWTGTRMVVWGGNDAFGGVFLDTGGVYDSAAGTWSATTTVGAPTARAFHAAVWTGSQMVVWGGSVSGWPGPGVPPTPSDTGAVYSNPAVLPPPPPPADFHTVTPCRVFDTRELSGPTLGAPLTCGTEHSFALAGKCGVPASATAVSVNLTGTASTAQGNLRLYPAGVPMPLVSTLNYTAGLTRANNAVAALGTGGQISVLCSPSGTTHVVLDVNGYFQ